eukprot:1030018-Pelagomonas_calceolata.AAC.1
MGALLPSQQMLGACRARYARTRDVAILAPVVAALSKAEVLELLPGLLQVWVCATTLLDSASGLAILQQTWVWGRYQVGCT